MGRYVAKTNVDVSQQLNPINTSVNRRRARGATRRSDAGDPRSGNFVPDCDLGNFTGNGECGAITNQFFGKTNPNAISWSDDVRLGWGVRDSNWDFSSEIQQELRTGLSVTAGYYRNTGGYYRNTNSKNRVADNILVTPSDFDTYCVTAPSDPRLPGGGGYQICGMADIKGGKFGQVQQVVEPTSDFGKNIRYNDFVSIGLECPAGGGRADWWRVRYRPLGERFVLRRGRSRVLQLSWWRLRGPHLRPADQHHDQRKERLSDRHSLQAQTQVKLNGSLPLKGGFVVSGVYQDLSGPAVEAVWAAPTALIAPSLGRNLSGGALTANVPLVAPQTIFEDRIRRLDLRVTKIFRLTQRVRLQANLDAYNALNSSAIQSLITAFGPSWLSPATILDARIFQVSGQLNF